MIMMMGASANNPSVACEQSLRKSFFAIHRQPTSFHSVTKDGYGVATKRRSSNITTDEEGTDEPHRRTSRRESPRHRQEHGRSPRRSRSRPRAKKVPRHKTEDRALSQAAPTESTSIVVPPSTKVGPPTGRGFRHDYALGDTARRPSHMTDDIDAVGTLDRHDFAFVRRSDGTYSYAIVACRTDEYIMFVVNGIGSVKMVSTQHWGEMIRLVSTKVASR